MFGMRLFEESLITSSCSILLQSYKFYLFFAIIFSLFSFLCAKSRIHGKHREKNNRRHDGKATVRDGRLLRSGIHLQTQGFPEVAGKGDILECDASLEERSYLRHDIASDAAADAGDEEALFRMFTGIGREAVDGSLEAVESLHRGNGVAATLHAFALSPDGSEPVGSEGCSTTGVHATGIAAEDEHLAWSQAGDVIGRDAKVTHGTTFVDNVLIVDIYFTHKIES